VAEIGGAPVGYVTVLWESGDPVFSETGTPEVCDLNVLPRARCRGIGSDLMERAEREVAGRSEAIGLRVGLHAGYGSAQRLYVRRGYEPDGTGVVYGRDQLDEGATARLDDDLTLRLKKSLQRPSASRYLTRLRAQIGNQLLVLPCVAVVVHDEAGRLLLVQERSTGEWGLPAGSIEPGEGPEQAARRELLEEAGIEVEELELTAALGGAEFRHVYPNGDRVEYQVFLFSCEASVAGEPVDGDEVRAVRFFSRDEAPILRLPYPPDRLWRRSP
jgi:8-oxo-dGTP pyrophosphatase MutT (NUDIX family)